MATQQEATQQPASKQEANGEGMHRCFRASLNQNTIQSNEMEAPVDMRYRQVQGNVASNKST